MTSTLKRDMKNTSDGVEITAIGTAFYHKMDRASAKPIYEEGTEIALGNARKNKSSFSLSNEGIVKSTIL